MTIKEAVAWASANDLQIIFKLDHIRVECRMQKTTRTVGYHPFGVDLSGVAYYEIPYNSVTDEFSIIVTRLIPIMEQMRQIKESR